MAVFQECFFFFHLAHASLSSLHKSNVEQYLKTCQFIIQGIYYGGRIPSQLTNLPFYMREGNAFWLDVINCDMDGLMQIKSNGLNASASVWFSLHQVKIIRFSSLLKTMKKYISCAYSVVLPSHNQTTKNEAGQIFLYQKN